MSRIQVAAVSLVLGLFLAACSHPRELKSEGQRQKADELDGVAEPLLVMHQQRRVRQRLAPPTRRVRLRRAHDRVRRLEAQLVAVPGLRPVAGEQMSTGDVIGEFGPVLRRLCVVSGWRSLLDAQNLSRVCAQRAKHRRKWYFETPAAAASAARSSGSA